MRNDKIKADNKKMVPCDPDVCHIVAASNDWYVPYLSVMIESVIKFSDPEHSYEITIVHTDISDKHMAQLKARISEFRNFNINFIDVTEEMKDYMDLFISNHIKIETYFRLLLPKLMPNVSKILYIDCDVIANADVYELYNMDIGDNYLIGTRDADSAANYNVDPEYKDYLDNIVKLSNPYDYVQAGIIVMNLDEFRKSCNTGKLLDTAMSRSWTFHDQDTLNFLCKGRIKFIDYAWNFVYDYDEGFRRSKNVIVNAPHYINSAYLKAKEAPKMIHFSWVNKPWFSPGVHYGEKFWMIARNSPFYEEIFCRCERDLGNFILNN